MISLTIYQPQTICSCDDPVCDSVCREWSICCACVCYLLLVSAPGFNTCSAPSRFNFFQMNPFYFLFWAWSRCLPPTGTVTEKRLLTFHQVRGMTRWGQASACQTYKDMGDKTCLCRDQPTLLLFHTVPTWNMSFALNGSVDRAVGKSLVWVAFIIWHLPHSVDTGSHYTQNKIKCKVFTSCCAIQSPQWMLAM